MPQTLPLYHVGGMRYVYKNLGIVMFSSTPRQSSVSSCSLLHELGLRSAPIFTGSLINYTKVNLFNKFRV